MHVYILNQWGRMGAKKSILLCWMLYSQLNVTHNGEGNIAALMEEEAKKNSLAL